VGRKRLKVAECPGTGLYTGDCTDSGGVPKEAFFYEVLAVILRKEAVIVALMSSLSRGRG